MVEQQDGNFYEAQGGDDQYVESEFALSKVNKPLNRPHKANDKPFQGRSGSAGDSDRSLTHPVNLNGTRWHAHWRLDVVLLSHESKREFKVMLHL